MYQPSPGVMSRLLVAIILLTAFHSVMQSQCVGDSGLVTYNYWQNIGNNPDTSMLFIQESFPEHPNGAFTIGSLEMPAYFDNDFAAMVRGFIHVPTTGNYKFNVTGNDRTYFFLSSDDLPENKSLIAYTPGSTGSTSHLSYQQQTSSFINLSAGQNYYFEWLHFDFGGSDHAQVWWVDESVTDTTYTIIDNNFISDYGCASTCEVRGTTCDDGDSNTYNDVWDGFCHCQGTPIKPNNCIGDRDLSEAYYYDNITGSSIEGNLYEDPDWPMIPDRVETLPGLWGPHDDGDINYYGTLVQGYIVVPVTGYYSFNMTSDNQGYFFLSSDEDPANLQTYQAAVPYSSGITEFNKYVIQTVGPIHLDQGKYYYYEIQHKENTGSSDDYNVYWRTPWNPSDHWKRIPSFYLYNYECSLACIPQGTPCDDGDPFTDNDVFDANCECAGTPCQPGDCQDPSANFIAEESCSSTENLDIRPEASWQSCQITSNPNPARNGMHWIMYDFGVMHRLYESRVWNYNVPGETDKGFRNLEIDYSDDGISWNHFGSYNWQAASGDDDYSGFVGPNFNDLKTRFVLISAADNWGDPGCSGFSKITILADKCSGAGTPCDDGNVFTENDVFDSDCNCAGTDMILNDCVQDTLDLSYNTLSEGNYSAKMVLQSGGDVEGGHTISFVAGDNIVLMPGFEVGQSSQLIAQIEDCVQENIISNIENQKNRVSKLERLDESGVQIVNKSGSDDGYVKTINYYLSKPSFVSLKILDNNGHVLATLVDRYHQNVGGYSKRLITTKLADPVYTIELVVDQRVIHEKLVVLSK